MLKEKYNYNGFTLIELLIVIAIIGVLAVVVLVAINPAQQLARTRDSGRKSAINQLGHAMEAYAISHLAIYAPDDGSGCTPDNWIGCLTYSGEIALIPGEVSYNISGSSSCSDSSVVNNTWCYDSANDAGAAPIIIYATLESTSDNSICASGETAYFVYSTDHGRGGTVCSTSEPQASGSWTFAN